MSDRVTVIIPSRTLAPSRLTRKTLRRIFSKIRVDRATGCWNWTGGLDPHYGLVHYRGKREKAHRLMFAWLVSPLPRGTAGMGATAMSVDHVCRNRSCCNPAHLELVSHQENVARGVSPAAESARRTHCAKGHEYRRRPDGRTRYCATCDNARHKARMAGPRREYWLQKARDAQHRQYAKQRAARTA